MADLAEVLEALDALVHACEDEIDDYPAIGEACKRAKELLPDYVPTERD